MGSLGRCYCLSRAERLRGVGAVSRLFGSGESLYCFPLRVVFLRRDSGSDECQDPSSVLFSVPKKLHKRANKRNLLRRRIKEAYRLHKTLLGIHQQGLDLSLLYSSKELLPYSKIERAVVTLLTQLSQQCEG